MKWNWIAIGIALLIYPWVFSGAFYENIGVLMLLSAIAASGWNIVGGYAGQVSVGHAMFFGAGAYMPLLLYKLWGLSLLAGIPAGIIVSLAIAVVIGIPTFRLQGHYFSMATIAVAELIRIVVSNWALLGAAIGLMGPAVPRGWWDFVFRSELPYYYLFLAVFALLMVVTYWMERSRFGYYLRAIRGSERAASSLGVKVWLYKLYALLLSAGFTALAGSLYALKTGFVDPDSAFGILISVQMVITAGLGGAGRLLGPLLGAVILVPLQVATNTWLGGAGTGVTYIIYGGIIVLLARFEPGGLLELWDRSVAPRLRRREFKRAHAA